MFILRNVCKIITTEKFCVGAVQFSTLKCALTMDQQKRDFL